MVCIPGGTVTLGHDKAKSSEKPAHKATLPTFYLDRTEVTNKDFTKCMKAGYCFRSVYRVIPPRYRGANKPAVYVSWHDARRYCEYMGKRLPTEAEWERAAQGPSPKTYITGNTPPKCKQARLRRCGGTTDATKNSPSGFGLQHMAGNVAEWVHDWYAPCYVGCNKACGKDCEGDAPKGPCKGSQICHQHRLHVVKGGSWRSRTSHARSSHRRGLGGKTQRADLGFRCASSGHTLHAPGQPVQLKKRPIPKTALKPLPPALKKQFWGTPEDKLTRSLCAKAGASGPNCRDPNHYVKSNEKRQPLFRPYIENLGGAYVGVGADQNYNFIVWARSSLVWLMDYDYVIVWVHKIHQAFLLDSPTAKDFVAYWSAKNATRAMKRLKTYHAKDPALKKILRVFRIYRKRMHKYFRRELYSKRPLAKDNWLVNPSHYAHIRNLTLTGRLRMMPGDLTAKKSLHGVMKAAKAMGVRIKVVYLSNAEEYWYYPPQYRKSFGLAPFDDNSVIIHTFSHPRWGHKKWGHFLYTVTHAKSYAKKLNIKNPKGYKGYYFPYSRELMLRFRVRSPLHAGAHNTMLLPTKHRP